MAIRIHSDFISDLIGIGDGKLAMRILRKVFDGSGRFIERGQDDHRYDKIKDGWIRYASKGLRVIFVRAGDDVLLYRGGPHAVEDNLPAPRAAELVPVVADEIRVAMTIGPSAHVGEYAAALGAAVTIERSEVGGLAEASRLLYNHADRFLYSNLLGRRFLPHKDVYLISPYLTADLLRSTDLFGQMLDDLIDGGAHVYLVTQPPAKVADIKLFEELSARKIDVFFNASLHAKIYAFLLNRDKLKPGQHKYKDFVAIGSANLTRSGINPLGLQNKQCQYELSYETTGDDWPQVEEFVLHVAAMSTDLDVVRANLY